MARKRLIAPEFFTHEALYQTEARLGLPLRVAFAGLWTQADRRGIFRWRPNQLKLAVLPYDPVEFQAVLDALVSAGFVERYEVAGEPYGIVASLPRWQTFHHAEKESDAPPPPPGSVSPRLIPGTRGKPRSNPTVAVAVTGTDTVAVGPSSSPDPDGSHSSGPAGAEKQNGTAPTRAGSVLEGFGSMWRGLRDRRGTP